MDNVMWLRHILRARPWDEWGTKEKTGKLGRKAVLNNHREADRHGSVLER